MSTRFFTNHGVQTLFAKYEGIFASNKDMAAFEALVGYSLKRAAIMPHISHSSALFPVFPSPMRIKSSLRSSRA